jgi:hypothetical protein
VSGRIPRLLRAACALTLVSLGLICWAILHPKPLAVIAAMSVGQGIGALGALLFLLVALRDLKPIFQARRSKPPPPPESAPSRASGGAVGVKPDDAKPDDAKPDDAMPDDTKPDDAKRDDEVPPGAKA